MYGDNDDDEEFDYGNEEDVELGEESFTPFTSSTSTRSIKAVTIKRTKDFGLYSEGPRITGKRHKGKIKPYYMYIIILLRFIMMCIFELKLAIIKLSDTNFSKKN